MMARLAEVGIAIELSTAVGTSLTTQHLATGGTVEASSIVGGTTVGTFHRLRLLLGLLLLGRLLSLLLSLRLGL